MFHSFFNSLARSRYLSFFSLSFSFILWSTGTAKPTILQVLFYLLSIIRSGLVCHSVYVKFPREFMCVIFQDGIVFVMWVVGGCTAAVFWGVPPGLFQYSLQHSCVIAFKLFLRTFTQRPRGVSIQQYRHDCCLEKTCVLFYRLGMTAI